MNQKRTQLLQELEFGLKQGTISRKDLKELLSVSTENVFSLTVFFYYLGACLFLSGIIFLLSQHWMEFGQRAHLWIAEGGAFFLYVAAILCEEKKNTLLAGVFFVMFSVLVPFAVSVLLYESGISIDFRWVSGYSACLCAWAFLCYRRTELLFFVILFLSATYLIWVDEAHTQDMLTFMNVLLLGLTFFLLGTFFAQRIFLQRALGFFGAFLIFVPLFFLRIPGEPWHSFWEIVFPLMLSLNFYLSLVQRNNITMALGFAVLVGYLFSLSSDYFLHSLGMTLTLMFSGSIIIAAVYILGRLKDKI